ncbi:MAG TPA: efflux RND transporter permease subunit [Thermoanaerobaculia bacterium]|nr:efflux RND transporter permease subunit [Thermoanaerobaculia bacterium]
MTSDRPLARLVLTLGLLILGIVALARLPLDYLPRQSFPELTVILTLGDTTDPGMVTREWIEEIESAIRSLGRVEEVGGEVRADGARLTVRFSPGTDPERKAARLESELADLRRRLLRGSAEAADGLWITPASEAEGELFAIVWLAGSGRATSDRGAEAAAEELRSVPGIQAVRVYGTRREEVRVETRGASFDPWEEAEAVRTEVERALKAPALGRVRQGSREWPLVVPPVDVQGVTVPRGGGMVPLTSLASVLSRWQEPLDLVRYRGEPARALLVWRAYGASSLAVDRALRHRLETLPGGMTGTVGWSDAEPLRELALRLSLALLLASGAAAITGGWLAGRRGALSLGLALPAAVAAAANAFWLAGIGLNVTTLVALAIGASAVLPSALLRVAGKASFRAMAFTAAAAAVTVPVTVALASEELGPLLSEPAGAFLLAIVGALAAAALVPAPSPAKRGRAGEGVSLSLPVSLRDPGTIVLFAATIAYVAAALFGPALLPRPADLDADTGSLVLRLRMPEGTTLEETARRIQEIEARVKEAEEIEDFWSLSWEGEGFVNADVRRRDRRPDRLARLVTRLRYGIAAGGSLTIETGGGGGGEERSGRRLEDRAEIDEEGNTYRAILRSADLQTLLDGYDRVLNRLAALKVRSYWFVRHDVRTVRLALRPVSGLSPERAAAFATHLRRASTPPRELRLPSASEGTERALLVVPAGVSTDPDEAPPMVALLQRPLLLDGQPFLPASSLVLREEVVQARIARQSGRFVMPVDLRIPLRTEFGRIEFRREIDRSLGELDLPTGSDLERPSLAPGLWQSERTRLIALGTAVPLLLFAVAACRLGSLLRGLVALAPLGLGLLAATPLIQSGLRQADELTVFALAAALALSLPAVVEGTLSSSAIRPARLYRSLRQETPWLLGAVPVLAVGLVAPTLGLDPLLLRWVTPLRAAAVAGGTALLASVLLSPALLLLARGAAERLRHPEEVRRRQRPPQWTAAGAPVLEAHTLTKVYGGRFSPSPPARGRGQGRGGMGSTKVTALSGVRFELTPGIVGLLGPNGAGKTTLLRILTGLLDPSRGEVRFRGIAVNPENLSEYRRQIGFLPQDFNAYPELTAEQFLDHWAIERGMGDRERRQEIERLLDAVGLTEHARRKVRDFSGGMRQRVGIARALLGSPPILIVDEPTTGLDVESRNRFRQILLEQSAERVVLFSTHIASDVEAAASRILLLHRGRLGFDGTPEELTARARGRVFRALIGDADLAEFSRRYRITARVRTLEGIRVRAVARPGDPLSGEVIEPNLEEAYLAEIDLADGARMDIR